MEMDKIIPATPLQNIRNNSVMVLYDSKTIFCSYFKLSTADIRIRLLNY